MQNLVDSSGWVEFFVGGPNANRFAPMIEDSTSLIVPTTVIYEVTKLLLRQWDAADTLEGHGSMVRGTVVGLDPGLALRAAQVSLRDRLPMADSIMLATARAHGATLWTQDRHFQGLLEVRYLAHA